MMYGNAPEIIGTFTLQTVPRGYTAHVSDSQRYKMLGNGWTVDVVAGIFKGLVDSSAQDTLLAA